MTHVEYVNTQRPDITSDDKRDKDCERLLNGLCAIADHCAHCDASIRAARPRAYRIRDEAGQIITDWVL